MSTPNFNAKMKAILDATTPGERVCPISLEKWTLTEEEIERCRKWNVPPSELAPWTRMRELAGWGAGIDLWWKPHMLSGKPVLSGVHPDVMVPVLPDDEWFAEDWGIKQAIEYDPSRPVFDQVERLFQTVPYPTLSTHDCTNVIGCGMVNCTNCYMIFGTLHTKDSWFTMRTSYSDRAMDTVFVDRMERCFSCAKCEQCANAIGLLECARCLKSAFLFNSENCENCFCSTNLRRKQYVFMNEQLTKEEYEKRMAEIDLSKSSVFEHWRSEFYRLVREQGIWQAFYQTRSENTVGDAATDCLNCDGYLMIRSRYVKDGWFVYDSENLDTAVISIGSNDVYYTSVALHGNDVKYTFIADESHAVEYCVDCRNIEYCFGCVGLQRKKFCIFNKQYTEETYWKTLDEIKCAMLDRGEYGKFFPAKYSPLSWKFGFAYVIAPFTSEELARAGAPDLDPIAGMRFAPYGQDTPVGDITQVPDAVKDVGEEWVGKPFFDAEVSRRFSVNEQELTYRKENGYPFPRRHYTHRLKELVSECNTPGREERACAKCQKQILSAVNAMFPDKKVYCKECYTQFLEGRA